MNTPTLNHLLTALNQVSYINTKPPRIPPKDCWTDAKGKFVPLEDISDFDQLVEDSLRPMVERHIRLFLELADHKARMHDDFETMIKLSWERHGVEVGGKKRNARKYLFDGSFMVERSIQARYAYDEQIGAAEELIRACLDQLTQGVDPALRKIVDGAFNRNNDGEIRRSEMVRLESYDIDHPQWKQAMEIIQKARKVFDSATYINVYVRDALGKYVLLPLDLASVRKHKQPQRLPIRPVRTDADLIKAMDEVKRLMAMNPDPNSPEGEALEIWTALIESYESRSFNLNAA